MKKERLGLEKEPDNFGLRTPCTTGFTPLAPRASHPNLKKSIAQEILIGKLLFTHSLPKREIWGLFIGFTKVWFLDVTDVVLKTQ